MSNALEFEYPPNIDLCLKHRKANRIFRSYNTENKPSETCQCCGKYVLEDSSTSYLWYNPVKELKFLGIGVPLMFIFIQNSILTIAALIAVFTMYAFISNTINDSCSKLNNSCYTDIFNKFSINDKLFSDGDITIQAGLVLATTIIWAIILQYFIYRIRKTEILIDFVVQSPSDYAIMISGLPQDCGEKQIQKMVFSRKNKLQAKDLKLTEDLSIQKILILYKSEEFFQEKLQDENRCRAEVKVGIPAKISLKKIAPPTEPANKAIVVFSKEISKSYFIPPSIFWELIRDRFCNLGDSPSKFTINQHPVSIKRAPQPDDIIWINIGKSASRILINKIFSFSTALLLLMVGGFIQYLLAKWQLHVGKEYQSIVSTFSSVIVTIDSYLITSFLVWATSKEGNATNTQENYSLNIKVCFFEFFHAGIFYSMANLAAADFDFDKLQNSFSSKITIFMIINALSPAIIMFITDYFEITNYFTRCLVRNHIGIYSQKEANRAFEMPSCDIPFKYAHVNKTIWLTFFYSPFVPIVSFISLFGLILYYFMVKFLFRTSYKYPNIYSNEINRGAIRLSYIAPFTLNMGQLLVNLYMIDDVKSQSHKNVNINYISLAIACVFIIIPWYTINEQIFEIKIDQKTNYKYAENFENFELSYDQAIPYCQGKSERVTNRDRNFIRYQEQIANFVRSKLSKQKQSLQSMGSDRKLI